MVLNFVMQVKKGLLKWWYPDAHDANENIGESLEAYFDQKTQRWVFPGEKPPDNDPSAGPPPTTMPGGPGRASANGTPALSTATSGNSVDTYHLFKAVLTVLRCLVGPSPSTTSPDDAPYDPLAALMAPPPRTLSYSGSASAPLSTLGGPNPFMNVSSNNISSLVSASTPPIMTTAGNAFSAFGASANNSTSAQLPPYQQQSTPQIPTGITMWKPSPAPSTNTASTVGVAGGDGFYQQQGHPQQLDEVSLDD
jgi:hypothetical protein